MSLGRFVGAVVAAFVAYGVLYTVGAMIFAADYAAMASAFKLPDDTEIPTMSYHLVQTIVFVWLFNKAVGSDDIKDGAVYGAMVGLYLMASDAIWFTNLVDFPQDVRIIQSVMNIVIAAIVGVLLAKMYGMGRGEAAAE